MGLTPRQVGEGNVVVAQLAVGKMPGDTAPRRLFVPMLRGGLIVNPCDIVEARVRRRSGSSHRGPLPTATASLLFFDHQHSEFWNPRIVHAVAVADQRFEFKNGQPGEAGSGPSLRWSWLAHDR